MERKIFIFFNVLLVTPLIFGNKDIICRQVDEAFNICRKDHVLVYVNETKNGDTLSVDEPDLTSIAANAFQNLSVRKLHSILQMLKNFTEDNISVYVDETKSKRILTIDEPELTSIAANAFQNLSIGELKLLLHDKFLTFEQESFKNLTQITELFISSAMMSLDENIFGAMPTLTTLTLRSCKIVEMKRGAFAGLPNLKTLRTDDSNISVINADIFHGASKNMDSLIFRYNLISNLEPDTFRIFENLRYLQLEGNRLTDIEPGVFNGLQKLDHLHLSNNHLTTIRRNVLNHLKELRWIWLDNNQINVIEAGAFDGLFLTSLDLECNRLKVISTGIFYGASIGELQLSCNFNLTIERNALSGTSIEKIVHDDPEQLGDEKGWGLRDSTFEIWRTRCECSNKIRARSG